MLNSHRPTRCHTVVLSRRVGVANLIGNLAHGLNNLSTHYSPTPAFLLSIRFRVRPKTLKMTALYVFFCSIFFLFFREKRKQPQPAPTAPTTYLHFA